MIHIPQLEWMILILICFDQINMCEKNRTMNDIYSSHTTVVELRQRPCKAKTLDIEANRSKLNMEGPGYGIAYIHLHIYL